MNGSPSAGHFAGLARKALQTTAIRPRLPSRYESAATGQDREAARTPEADASVAAPRVGPLQAGAPMPMPTARAPSQAEGAPTALAPANALPHASPAMAPPAKLPAHAYAYAPVPVLGEPASPPLPSAGRQPQADAARPADAHTLRRLLGEALQPQAGPATPTPTTGPGPGPGPGPAPAVALSGGLSGPPPPRSAEAAGLRVDPALALRARIAQQVPRLLDEASAPAVWATLPAGGEAAALPAAPPNAGSAAPRVDITIGSIAIVLTQAPAAAPVRAAAPVAAPAVQSLDAYLQARQRRGGR